MRNVKVILPSCLLSFACLACRAQATPQAYGAISGNWRISPTHEPTPSSTGFESFILTMGVDGDKAYGRGQLNLGCGDHSGVAVEGEVLPDGSFTLANTSVFPDMPARSFEVQGKLPAAGATEWHGSFFSHFPGHDSKCMTETGEVMVRQLPVITGSFMGTVRSRKGGGDSEVSMEILQRQLVFTRSPVPGFDHCVPVHVKMTVKGDSGPFAGAFAAAGNSCDNSIDGDVFTLRFQTIGGGTLLVVGFIDYSHETADRVTLELTYLPRDQQRGVIANQPATAWGEVMRQQGTPESVHPSADRTF